MRRLNQLPPCKLKLTGIWSKSVPVGSSLNCFVIPNVANAGGLQSPGVKGES